MGIGNPPFGSENQQGFGILGVEAQGNLIQAGGDFFSFFLTMGQEVGGQGIYLLQAGTSRQKDLTIGQAGHGSVSNTSGIHSVDDLILDLFAGGTGEYGCLDPGPSSIPGMRSLALWARARSTKRSAFTRS